MALQAMFKISIYHNSLSGLPSPKNLKGQIWPQTISKKAKSSKLKKAKFSSKIVK